MPQSFVWYVRNQSASWLPKRLIVLHTTEGHNRPGVTDLLSLASWFNTWSSRVSAHKGVDQEGNKITMVSDSRKAWHAGWVNGFALGLEQIGFAASSKQYWIKTYHNGLVTVAKQLADWSIKHNIPLQISSTRGVIGHRGVSGHGGHWDPGANYPLEYVVVLATIWRMRKKGNHLKYPKVYKALVARVHAAQRRSGVTSPTIHWR